MSDSLFLPYGRQSVDEDDIQAVVEVLRSDWLTTGPLIERFESSIADLVGAEYAVAVSSGTAALHAAMYAIGIGPGDEVIVPPVSFVATANAVVFLGGTPVFVDVGATDLLIVPALIERKISSRTKAIIAVDYAGQPCGYEALRDIADKHGLYLVSDACHSLGATYQGHPCGSLADLTGFSFHPVKPITTGEGGMIVTSCSDFAERMRRFRNHGIDMTHQQRAQQNHWRYKMVDIGFNYRLTDLQAALGLSQLAKLPDWIEARQEIARLYQSYLQDISQVKLLDRHADRESGWHLMVIRVSEQFRNPLFHFLRTQGIGVNVHYELIYQHPYYQQHYGLQTGCCPVAEQISKEIISLPIYPGLGEEDIRRVCKAIETFFKTE